MDNYIDIFNCIWQKNSSLYLSSVTFLCICMNVNCIRCCCIDMLNVTITLDDRTHVHHAVGQKILA